MDDQPTVPTTPDQLIEKQPLLIFSVYTVIQLETLRTLGAQITTSLDAMFAGEQIDYTRECYGKFWLWVLGSYEVVRTMTDGGDQCFAPLVAERLQELKRHLAKLRIPFAKQEMTGRRRSAIAAEPSVYTMDRNRKDFAFKVKDEMFWVRETIARFDETIAGINRTDVVKDLREVKGKKPRRDLMSDE